MAKPTKTRNTEIDLDEELAGFDEADAEGRLPKLRDGAYTGLRIDMCKFKPGYNGLSFIVEMTLCGEHVPADPEETPDRVGKKLSATINGFSDKNRSDLAMGNLKGFLAATMNLDGSKIKLSHAKSVSASNFLGKPHPKTGARFFVDAPSVEKKRMPSGHDFVMIVWGVSEFEPAATDDVEPEAE